MHTHAANTCEHFDPASFRDPAGKVFYRDGAVYRGLGVEARAEWLALSATTLHRRFEAQGKLIRTEQVDPEQVVGEGSWAALLRHEKIPFISYPYEWCFGMLQDAALLHLELLAAALEEDMILKDATPYNVQWQGARPVFIDIPSLVRLVPGAAWMGYRQFCQTHLYPLFLQAYRNVPFQPWLRGRLDGITAAECNALCSWRDLLRPGVFLDVFLQAKLQNRLVGSARDIHGDLKSAGFRKEMIQANVRRLTRVVRRLCWRPAPSAWSNYDATATNPEDVEAKLAFVRAALESQRWDLVWDLGANTGRYSRLAADYADYVVALDADVPTVERLYRQLKAESRATILPLACDLADTAGGLGWRGRECKPLTERGRPDLVLCLALVHHLALGANIPLRDLVGWLAEQTRHLVLEFVTRDDPKVQLLLRHKDYHHPDYDLDLFEGWLRERFVVHRRQPLPSGTRILYHASTV